MRAALLILASIVAGVTGAESLRLTSTVPLPGVKGRFDHFAVDTNTHRVFVAALGNNTLEVIDAAAGKRLHTIAGLHKPTGVAFIPDSQQLFVANGDDGTVKVFDAATYKLVKSIGGFRDADNLRVHSRTRNLYVGYGEGALGIIDLTRLEQTISIPLRAHPESFQIEAAGSRIYVNVPDAREIAVIDGDKMRQTGAFPMQKFEANFPMALDETNHRLFVGCRKPAQVVVLDVRTEPPVPLAELSISGDTDDLFWNAARRRLYVSCGEGFIDVIEESGNNKFLRREHLGTRPGARTSFFSPELGEFYLAVPARKGDAAELRVFEVR